MFLSRISTWDQGRDGGDPSHCASGVFIWLAIVGATLTMLTLVTVGTSHAYARSTSAAPPVTETAARVIAQISAAPSSATTLSSDSALCPGHGPDGHGANCPGACGLACPAGMIIASSALALIPIPGIDIPRPRSSLLATDLVPVFRPPRLTV